MERDEEIAIEVRQAADVDARLVAVAGLEVSDGPGVVLGHLVHGATPISGLPIDVVIDPPELGVRIIRGEAGRGGLEPRGQLAGERLECLVHDPVVGAIAVAGVRSVGPGERRADAQRAEGDGEEAGSERARQAGRHRVTLGGGGIGG